MSLVSASPLAAIEPRLRTLLPADLYAAVWVDPHPNNLMRVFEHLRTLQHNLHGYTPRQVLEAPPSPGAVQYTWQEGTLLFTDLAGFTPLLEANASYGEQGAAALLNILNHYFSEMIEIISKSGGDLLEFTGDAMLVQFPANQQQNDTAQAIRAGLRMQRAMNHFSALKTAQGAFSLGMRVGVHTGRFLTADIGTPMRMAHVLLGKTVQRAKQAESCGRVQRVCLTTAASDRLPTLFQVEPASHTAQDSAATLGLVKDNLSVSQLGEYDIALRRRLASPLLLDRSLTGLVHEIEDAVQRIEPLASYLPLPILNLLVERAAQRQIPPNFSEPTVLFVNVAELPDSIDDALPHEVDRLIACFSRIFALIDAAIRARDGILQKVTYQLVGSDLLIYFGVLNSQQDATVRAADAALAIRSILSQVEPPPVAGQPIPIYCRMGLVSGPVFAAEIGESRGRREFNILGDPVNTAARLMSCAMPQQILMTQTVYQAIAAQYDCEPLGNIALKGKAHPVPIFALRGFSPAD